MDRMNEQSPARVGRSDRGAVAREALVAAAVEAFGRDGFDSVSIRRIADKAGVNTAMISYYFGGKEGLYAASVQHIADQIGDRMGPVATAIQDRLAAEDMSRQQLFQALCSLTDGLLEMLTRPQSTAWARIILREMQDPSEYFQILFQSAMGRVISTCVLLHARINGRQEPDEQDRLGALTLVAQVVVFRTNRAAVLRLMGWDTIESEQLDQIKQQLHGNYARILGVEHE
jgi:AcrR family transcriptional regulator